MPLSTYSWYSSIWLNASGTTSSLLSLWINFMSISAKVSCQCNYFAMARSYISKYLKDTLFMKTLIFCNPKQCYQVLKQFTITNNYSWVGNLSWVPTIFFTFKGNGVPFLPSLWSLHQSFIMIPINTPLFCTFVFIEPLTFFHP